MNKSRKTFCFPVAIGFIAKARFKRSYWLSIRRSFSFFGLILHAAVLRMRRDEIVMIDYIPNKPKSSILDADGDSMFAFVGKYRVCRYRRISSGSGDTFVEAVRSLRKNTKGPSGPSSFDTP